MHKEFHENLQCTIEKQKDMGEDLIILDESTEQESVPEPQTTSKSFYSANE